MGITSWDVKFYEGYYTLSSDGSKVSFQTERELNSKDQVHKNRSVIAVISVTGYSPTNGKSYFKAQIAPYAYSKQTDEQAQNISIRPRTIIATKDGGVIQNVDPAYTSSTEGQKPIEYTNYPTPFSQYGETDTIIALVGPFEGEAVLNYDDIISGSVAVIMYEGSESGPGPTPTSAEGGKQ